MNCSTLERCKHQRQKAKFRIYTMVSKTARKSTLYTAEHKVGSLISSQVDNGVEITKGGGSTSSADGGTSGVSGLPTQRNELVHLEGKRTQKASLNKVKYEREGSITCVRVWHGEEKIRDSGRNKGVIPIKGKKKLT